MNDGTGTIEIDLEYSVLHSPPAWLEPDIQPVDVALHPNASAWVFGEQRIIVELTADYNMRRAHEPPLACSAVVYWRRRAHNAHHPAAA